MFGLGWSEVILIGIVALIVIGPKDLPNMFRELGRMSSKARGMAHEFQRAMEQAADDSGVRDISKSIQAAANPAKFGVDKLRESAEMTYKPGTETAKLSAERQASKDALGAATAHAAEERRAREIAAADAAEMSEEPEPFDAQDVAGDLLPPTAVPSAAPAQAMPAPTGLPPIAEAVSPPAKVKKPKVAKAKTPKVGGPDVLPKLPKPPKAPKAAKVRAPATVPSDTPEGDA
ncbi:sec-independent protein translocase protein TatB [Loktanella fryxellensis]|uniref:Sec-independent protein translocase protein TatB n=1 Tax=Loktanella fryxellensis TaxID=245187 RepID=A0A1H7YWA4_9RHOB|nr:Sec-independent protein translocase protein TatB [Loktanella fryxellensis]SEM50221.1 sec-independent protein translocase protein TatB [Loktanella fryxellensis]